jgi:hypothetical protein
MARFLCFSKRSRVQRQFPVEHRREPPQRGTPKDTTDLGEHPGPICILGFTFWSQNLEFKRGHFAALIGTKFLPQKRMCVWKRARISRNGLWHSGSQNPRKKSGPGTPQHRSYSLGSLLAALASCLRHLSQIVGLVASSCCCAGDPLLAFLVVRMASELTKAMTAAMRRAKSRECMDDQVHFEI